MLPPDDFDPKIGLPETLEPGLRRIVAPNPSPMTYRGTNTYLIGETDIAVIDPGPDSAAHLDAIQNAIQPGQRISHIIVTHTHVDHSPLARPLADACGAPIYAFGNATAGRSPIMQELARAEEIGGGEGVDLSFQPDRLLADGDVVTGEGWQLDVLHTPGHIGNHICLGMGDACLTADHVMGWATSLVSPPDGDLTDFMASCERLAARDWRVFYPGHGAPVHNPAERLAWLMAHRRAREASILDALQEADATAAELANVIYVDTPSALLGAATRNVLAHLVDLTGRGSVHPLGSLQATARFRLN
ncbi:MBL fold metallo-hydrolase [Sulfitobacter sp. S0837]|uniref:MBL fold metallo-hydrolase n=1 Tax=Sulfitobacter maritimus TaxID=2741719 RepID=UPI001583C0BE|nr:MBL fold metallo-hydrolase [Sulfitobacter maritimus]NUH64378.1 MBL fold metallo-hydrolase [Sulfitobacter maritimus]